MKNGGTYNCATDYFADPPAYGCAPNAAPLKTGSQWAGEPGTIVAEATDYHLKLFFFPDGDEPADLVAGAPRPGGWDAHLVSFVPFGASGHANPLAPAPPPRRRRTKSARVAAFSLMMHGCSQSGACSTSVHDLS